VARVRGEGRPRANCHERALGLLAVRQRSRRELEQRLLRAGYPAPEVDDVLERLQGVGLIDDRAFARALAEHAFTARKQGRRSVASSLASKGVDPRVAAAVIDEMGDDEAGRAAQLAEARAARLAGLEPAKAYQRLTGLLLRRGYSPELAHAAARKALAVQATED
jgi:regulatory protein